MSPWTPQLAFRLTYDPWGMALDLSWAALQGLGLLAVAALLYLVPGVCDDVSPLPQPLPSPDVPSGEGEGG